MYCKIGVKKIKKEIGKKEKQGKEREKISSEINNKKSVGVEKDRNRKNKNGRMNTVE